MKTEYTWEDWDRQRHRAKREHIVHDRSCRDVDRNAILGTCGGVFRCLDCKRWCGWCFGGTTHEHEPGKPDPGKLCNKCWGKHYWKSLSSAGR